MKRIAVFCDGTWNGSDQPYPTNVRRMAVMVPQTASDGTAQIALYFPGVGVPEDGSWLERLNEKLSGGAMGFGLDDKIAIAYLHLCRHYQPGDEVLVFGFSRGAYTARSLVGLIRNCGLPRSPTPELVQACFARYRDRTRETKPDSADSMAFRLKVSPWITTSPEEAAWRRTRGHPEGQPFRIAYLGVWDTVGALGIPSHWGLPARVLNRKYRFHDTDLSRMVRSARHAVATDEERRTFVPTLWTNLAQLRADNPDGDYRQEWFAGVHGAVGGGGDVVGLSNLALLWIAQGAMREGLVLDPVALEDVRRGCNPMAVLHSHSGRRSVFDRMLGLTGRARTGPDSLGMVAHPTIARWRSVTFPTEWGGRPYRPLTLAALANDLDGFDLARIEDYAAARVA